MGSPSRSRSRSRGRKKKSKRKSRSRSREKKRKSRRSRSRTRSRTPEKKEKKPSMWDKNPMEAAALMPQIGAAAPPPGALGAALAGFARPPDPKKARTVYVGNVQPDVTADHLRKFFNSELPKVQGRPFSAGDPVDLISINHEKMYAFVEFTSSTDADIAMSMDGVRINGHQLRVRRPQNYVPPPTTKQWSIQGFISSNVPDGPNKIFLGGLPIEMTDQQVQNVVSTFGQLAAFTLAKDFNTGLSRGYAFFSYVDESLTAIACAGLNNKEIGGKTVVCKPARSTSQEMLNLYGAGTGMNTPADQLLMGMGGMNQGIPVAGAGPSAAANAVGFLTAMAHQNQNQQQHQPYPGAAAGQPPPLHQPSPSPSAIGRAPRVTSTVLCLENMVTLEELKDDDEYEDIVADVREECSIYGTILNIYLPRAGAPESGRIFLHYDSLDSAQRAADKLSGRKFANRTIVCTSVDEQRWAAISAFASR